MTRARTAGLSGLAVTLAAIGVFVAWAGIRDVPITDGLRTLLRGELPEGRPAKVAPVPDELRFTPASSTPAQSGGGGGQVRAGLGAKIATEAVRHVGVPYRWGGNDRSGWDCSGFVTYVLRAVGVGGLPGARPTSASYLTWSGAITVPRADCAPGDLVCWTGHIGIALSPTTMINAPSFGIPTRIQAIHNAPVPPVIRRVKG